MLCYSHHHKPQSTCLQSWTPHTLEVIPLLPFLHQPHISWLLWTKLEKLNHPRWVTSILSLDILFKLLLPTTHRKSFTCSANHKSSTDYNEIKIWFDIIPATSANKAWIALLFFGAVANMPRSSLKFHLRLLTGESFKSTIPHQAVCKGCAPTPHGMVD